MPRPKWRFPDSSGSLHGYLPAIMPGSPYGATLRHEVFVSRNFDLPMLLRKTMSGLTLNSAKIYNFFGASCIDSLTHASIETKRPQWEGLPLIKGLS